MPRDVSSSGDRTRSSRYDSSRKSAKDRPPKGPGSVAGAVDVVVPARVVVEGVGVDDEVVGALAVEEQAATIRARSEMAVLRTFTGRIIAWSRLPPSAFRRRSQAANTEARATVNMY
jgi:hypothetical protein